MVSDSHSLSNQNFSPDLSVKVTRLERVLLLLSLMLLVLIVKPSGSGSDAATNQRPFSAAG